MKYYLLMLVFNVLPIPHAEVEYVLFTSFTNKDTCEKEAKRLLASVVPETGKVRNMVCAHVDLTQGELLL